MNGKPRTMNTTETPTSRDVAMAAVTVILDEVIADLINCDFTLSGDDSELQNIWEDVCAQKQHQESVMWDLYVDYMLDLILAAMKKLNRVDLIALWLQAEGERADLLIETYEREEAPARDEAGQYDFELIAQYILQKHLFIVALNYTNENIEKYLRVYQMPSDFQGGSV